MLFGKTVNTYGLSDVVLNVVNGRTSEKAIGRCSSLCRIPAVVSTFAHFYRKKQAAYDDFSASKGTNFFSNSLHSSQNNLSCSALGPYGCCGL
jgi:hypothetical protein